MNAPALYNHEDTVANDLFSKDKPQHAEEWIAVLCAWLILILVWVAAMAAYIE